MAMPIPKGGALRLKDDVWGVLEEVVTLKGLDARDRTSVAAAIIRCYGTTWATGNDCPDTQPQPQSLSEAPAAPPVVNVLDAL